MRAENIPVLILPDARERAWASLEVVKEKDGFCRIFKEFSDPVFKTDKAVLARLGSFLACAGASMVRFEDNKSGTLRSILKKLHYSKVETYDLTKKVAVSPVAASDSLAPGMETFGIAGTPTIPTGERVRRFEVAENGIPIGSLIMTDYGRFARAKANRFGSEGFGLIVPGKDPAVVLTAVANRLQLEGKQYMILGEEYGPHVDLVHPFHLWHMKLRGPKVLGHGCRVADKSDIEMLSRLTCEYEDTDIASATSTVLKNLGNPEFKYLLPAEGDGFALLKFLTNGEGMIHDLYVSPKNQGKGIGDELTRGAISLLSESCLSIHLNTIYPRARMLYEKYGFSVEYTDHCIALNQEAMSRS